MADFLIAAVTAAIMSAAVWAFAHWALPAGYDAAKAVALVTFGAVFTRCLLRD